jgi:outer membrane protein
MRPIRVVLPVLSLLTGPGPLGCSRNAHAKEAPLITLEHAYNITARSDQTIRIARQEVRKAELLPWSALTRMGPILGGGFEYDRRGTSLRDPGTSTGTFSLEQPLLDFSVFPAHKRGKLAAESSRLARNFTVRETLFGVTSAYFEVLKSERQVAVNRQSLVLAGEQEALAQKRADVGEVTRTDVLRATFSKEAARRLLITSENTLEFRRNTLRNILNMRPETPFRVVEPLPYHCTIPDFASLLNKAYARREDLRQSTLLIQQAELRRQEFHAQYAPSIVARGVSRSAPRSLAETWGASVAVQVPFFTGGQREIELVNAQAEIEKASLQRELLLEKIEAEVKQACLNLETIEGSLAAVRAQVAAAEQGYKDLQNQYAAGTARSVDVLLGLQDLSTARLDLTSLSLDYQVALRALDRVSGTFQEIRVKTAFPK